MGNGNEDGEEVAEKDGEKQVEEEAEKDGAKETEKDGAKEAETTPEGICCWLFFSCAIGLDLVQ